MKVLVTGARGLIGSEALGALARAGSEVVGVVRGASHGHHSDNATLVSLDLQTEDSARRLVALAPEVIVHAAAILPQGFLGETAERAAWQNRAIDEAVFAVARTVGCRIVYLSGTSLYGCVRDPCTEDSGIDPRGPYLQQKARGEQLALALPNGGVVLRISAPYGVRQRAATVLQTFVRRAVRGEDLLYYGTGAREQDFIAVEDVGEAVVAATSYPVAGIYNVASGRATTMRDLASLVARCARLPGSRVHASGVEDPEEECRARINITKAERVLQWRPILDLETGVGRVVAALAGAAAAPSTRNQDGAGQAQ
jgi:nucleoside-diphosphate-sugar epimerase